jgi:hypothetical protein
MVTPMEKRNPGDIVGGRVVHRGRRRFLAMKLRVVLVELKHFAVGVILTVLARRGIGELVKNRC